MRRPLLLFLASGLFVGLAVLLAWQGYRAARPRAGALPLAPLQVYGEVPAFTLTERSGRRVRLADLRGTLWIANFIYTRCTDTCPLQSAEMARLQRELADLPAVRLVSISVDPAHDTPAVLARYAARFGADAQRWLFLTGDEAAIRRLVQEGFRLSAVPAAAQEGIILHSSRFVLVDAQGRIRGYYRSDDPDALRRLRRDVRTLWQQHARAS
ncbi:MAG: hypothetical protein KatS3mg131_3921 [Candidatus Tectimicrobiota bacterium]|nr:MAG: hypothetical protein KatS3mg131_3921 [Candidatus Tectomicrobia bacterium]